MSEGRDDIDWSVTTWDGGRRAQLCHALTLTLRERMEAVEGLADVARRFQEMRARGEFRALSEPPGGEHAGTIADDSKLAERLSAKEGDDGRSVG